MAKLTKEQREEIKAKLEKRNGTMAEIAREFGVSRVYIRALTLRLGLKWYSQAERAARSPSILARVARAKRAEERTRKFNELVDAWQSGTPCEEIAVTKGYPTQVFVVSLVARLRKKYGAEVFPYRRPNRETTVV